MCCIEDVYKDNAMSIEVWIAIGIVFAACWCIIIYGLINAPMMPDDYGIEDDELWKELNGSKEEKKLPDADTDKWYPDNKI